MKCLKNLSVYISSENSDFYPKFREVVLTPEIAEIRWEPLLFGWEVTEEKSENIKQQHIKCLSQASKYFVIKTSA